MACTTRTTGDPAAEDELAKNLVPDAEAGLNVFLGGQEFLGGTTQRFALGLTDDSGLDLGPVEARAWIASEDARSHGPFDLTYVPYGKAQPGDPKGFFVTSLPVPRGGIATVLVEAGSLFGTAALEPRAQAHVPAPGNAAVAVATPTFGHRRGVETICTRVPACPMHDVRLDRALGTRPVVFTIASPLLCRSRTCGPVVDEVVTVRREHRREAAFIHAEVYEGNTPTILAPASEAWRIESEPWTFVIDGRGVVRARFEGPVVAHEIAHALEQVF